MWNIPYFVVARIKQRLNQNHKSVLHHQHRTQKKCAWVFKHILTWIWLPTFLHLLELLRLWPQTQLNFQCLFSKHADNHQQHSEWQWGHVHIHMSRYTFSLSNKYWNLHEYNFTVAKQIVLIGVGAFNACMVLVIFNVFESLCRWKIE